MRLPPALAASATPRILELLGEPPARVLELGFAGIHAMPLRFAGFDVVRNPTPLSSGRERAGDALASPPDEPSWCRARGRRAVGQAHRVILVGG
jgi:hypothetical protein